MEYLRHIIDSANDILWSYVLIASLLGCALWFIIGTRGVQFRMLREMFRLLGESTVASGDGRRRHISSFQAFAVSLASRVGTGNMAGVATAIAVGGPGAVFWMWVIALLGSASAFVESTLAQLYKRRDGDTFIGGPAYYMETGLGKRWMGVLFAVLISVTFGFAFNSVQSNTICAAWQGAFGLDVRVTGIVVAAVAMLIIFGGIRRIAGFSSIIVPLMALLYVGVALVVVLMDIKALPAVVSHIVGSAFGWHQAIGGGLGAAVMQGIKRGLFSNEAGMGSAPNAAATAYTSHPVKQGLIQTLGVFTDTLLICSCTAFIILSSNVPLDGSLSGVQLTQAALVSKIGPVGGPLVAVVLFLLAFSSIIGNYYYGESNIRFITRSRAVLALYRIGTGAMIIFGALSTLDMVWSLADVTMALMTLCNLVALVLLGPQAFALLEDYVAQKRRGIRSPVFHAESLPDVADKTECW